MKLRNNNILGKSAKTIALFLGASALSLTSCRDNDFDWETAHQNYVQKIESEYAEHFKQIFGEVDPNQNWDFTLASSTRALNPNAVISTFGAYNGSGQPLTNNSDNNWFEVPTAINTWLNSNMKEKIDNSAQGKTFSFIVPPTRTFDLIPIYQGLANSYWDMYAVVKNKNGVEEEIKFWEKNQGIQIKQNNVHWNGNAFYLKNKVSNRYLRSSSNQYKIVTQNDANQDYDYQFFIDFSKKNYQGKDFTLIADVRAANRTANIYGQTHTSCGNYAANFGEMVEVGTSWKTIKMTGKFPNTGGVIALPLANDRSGNTFYFDNITVYVGGNNITSDAAFFAQTKGSGIQSISPETTKDAFYLTEKTSEDCWNAVSWDKASDPDVYKKVSKEMGVRFGVVSIKYNTIENKYLLAFLDKPENGLFVTVDNNGKLVTRQTAEACMPVNSYGGYYDDFLMLGDYLVYEENGEIRTVRFANATRPWEFSDITAIDNDKFRWNCPSSYRYRYEEAKVAGGFGVNSIRGHYDPSNASSYVNVRLDFGEMTMGSENADHTYSIKDTRTKGIHFEFPAEYIGCEVYFYWKTRSPFDRAKTAEGARLTSRTQMLAINYPDKLDGFIPNKKNIMVIGCEAAVISNSDRDFNDMVFLLVSDDKIEFNEVPEIVEKRYMVEDLGATDDIDFNDMVVDVKQTTIKKYKYVDGNLQALTPSVTQEVILRAMGGTLDFDFKIGDTKIFTKSTLPSYNNYQTMYKTGMQGGKSTLLDNYNSELYKTDLKDKGNPWNPSTNNVSFTVYKDGKSATNTGVEKEDNDGSYEITFPNIGDAAPHIIAFPVTKLWRDERHECCTEWLYDREPALWEMPENTDTPNTHTENFANWISNNKSVYLNWVKDNFSETVMNSMATWVNKYYPNATSNTEAGE